PETVRNFDKSQQVRLRSVARRDRTRLVLVPKIEPVERIVTDRKTTRCSFARIRQPEGRVTRFGEFRDAPFDLFPGSVEVFQHRLAATHLYRHGHTERGEN